MQTKYQKNKQTNKKIHRLIIPNKYSILAYNKQKKQNLQKTEVYIYLVAQKRIENQKIIIYLGCICI